jgi:hypothetical protein
MTKQPLIQFIQNSNLVSLRTAEDIAATFEERTLNEMNSY